jgi:hypothetical protein
MKDVAALQAAKIKAQYQDRKIEKKTLKKASGQVGERHDIRRRILEISLFPNVFNRREVYTEEGAE